jgi:sister-chromatid-cohesion protein PDS5
MMSVRRATTRQKKGSGGGGSRDEVSTSTDAMMMPMMIYPKGCKEVDEDMGVDELIRRLKVLATAFQSMGQLENNAAKEHEDYVPVCVHLASFGFLNHESKDVRLLVACCIADILRIYAPEAPYKDPETVKVGIRS